MLRRHRARHEGPSSQRVVAWKGPNKLLVTYDDRSTVRRKELSVPSVSVVYHHDEPSPTTEKSPFAGSWRGVCSIDGRTMPISFRVAQFGQVFDITLDDKVVNEPMQTYLDDSGQYGGWDTKLTLKGNRITGTFTMDPQRNCTVDMRRSGPTIWVAPPSETYP